MKIKNFNTSSNNCTINEQEYIPLNKTYEKNFILRNATKKNRKNIISLRAFISPKNTYNNNNEISNNKINSSSLCENNISYNKNNEFKKQKTFQVFNDQNIKNKLKIIQAKSFKNNFKKYTNSSYSHSSKRNNLCNKKILNTLGISDLNENLSQIKHLKENNKHKTIKNFNDFENNYISLKNKLKVSNKKNENKENENILNLMEGCGETFYDENILGNLTEKNNNINYKNFINNILNDSINKNKRNKRNKFNNLFNYESNEKELISKSKDTLTKDEFYLLIKKFNLLLEEKQIYKKKILILQKENKKLKNNIKYNYNNEKIYEKERIEFIELKNNNNELKKENDFLKNEINNLTNIIKELTINKNKNYKILTEQIEPIPLNYYQSFSNSFGGISLPSNERYTKTLGKKISNY